MRTFSVVVNTLNRADSLERTLAALELLDHPSFEVVVVDGPSSDHTGEVLARFEGRIKVAKCSEVNLSMSRNIGIRMAAGEIVAFIDDDAYPDPAWLDRLSEAYDDAEVAAAGGPTYGPTGYGIQAWTSLVDRLGNTQVTDGPSLSPLSGALSYPDSNNCPVTMGTNSSFRRDLLVSLGGFDEQFRYYHEEADLCRRLVDLGYVVASLDDGFVYHKFLPSHIRAKAHLGLFNYDVIRSKVYFALKHGLPHHSFGDLWSDVAEMIRMRRDDAALLVEAEDWCEDDVVAFEDDLVRAISSALESFFFEGPRLRDPAWFSDPPELLPLSTRRARGGKLRLCLLAPQYPPDEVYGIGRIMYLLATGLAGRGHDVHVLTGGHDHIQVDLEDRVWVHRVPAESHAAPASLHVPTHIWDFSASLLVELERLHAHRPVDLVQAPNWDSPAIAVALDGRFPLSVGLYTPLLTVARADSHMARMLQQGDPTISGLAESERFLYEHADRLIASTPSVVEEIEAVYGLYLDPTRLSFVPLGLPDLAGASPRARSSGEIDILFVGRLEPRKGIDVLLAAANELVEGHADVTITVVGDQSWRSEDGLGYVESFSRQAGAGRHAVHFVGPVDDATLASYYAACDIVVVPSRYESFGLMLLEAMMFSKPVVASDVGGMRHIVVDGETGFLVPVGDAEALRRALSTLVESAELRGAMGHAGRRRYESHYTLDVMLDSAEAVYGALSKELGTRTSAAVAPA